MVSGNPLGQVTGDQFEGQGAANRAAAGPVTVDAAGRHSITEFLDHRERVVLAVIGPPGSGKSTLLAHVARLSAQAHRGPLSRDRPRGRRRIPVLLAFRRHAGSIVATPEISLADVIRSAVGGVPGKEHGGWWDRQLDRGRCLILLDGLDEVARDEERRIVVDWVVRQINTYADTHFVVTSRPHGFPGPLIPQADVLQVRTFTPEQVQLFLNRWYFATELHATGATSKDQLRAVRIVARESADRLIALLRAHPALHDLTVNPLLLTMIATVHRYRGALPGSRADLYGEICQVLLSRRIQAKDLPEVLPWPAKQKLLGTLAYQMMRDDAIEWPASQVAKILKPQLDRLPESLTDEAFLDDIERNGLLIRPTEGLYSFSHKTFQEYLAAQHISANPRLAKSLADTVNSTWWRETILLYATMADATPIVRACLDSGAISALALAFDCAETSNDLSPDLRDRLDDVYQQAYKPGCPSEQRRLIAAVQAARLMRQALTTANGIRICDRPVPAELYYLFLQDTQATAPDNPCSPHIDQPATGIWGSEALGFVQWLNSITTAATGAEIRLPSHDELEEESITSALRLKLPTSVTSAWTRADTGMPGRWLPRVTDPHLVTGQVIQKAIVNDTKMTGMLAQLLAAQVLDSAFEIARDIHLACTRARALNLDRAGYISSDLDRAMGRARNLDRVLDRASDLSSVRDLMRALARDLSRDINFARTIARGSAISSEVTRDLTRDLGRALDQALDITRSLALVLAIPLAHDLNEALPIVSDFGHERAISFTLNARPVLPWALKVPLLWVVDGPLTRISQTTITAKRPPHDVYAGFAAALASCAGIDETTRVIAELDGSLAGNLRSLTSATSEIDTSSAWRWAEALLRLADSCAPMLDSHQCPDQSKAAAIRSVTLALADELTKRGHPGSAVSYDVDPRLVVLRAVAATVTLMEQRRRGEAEIGEAIILAVL
jgi:hypothetical protein